MKKKFLIGTLLLWSLYSASCVSSKKLKDEKAKNAELYTLNEKLKVDIGTCEEKKEELTRRALSLETEVANLNKHIDFLKENSTQALKQLEDLSVISASQAESIKKSLENMGVKDAYIQDLQTALARKDSLNMALVLNLKGAIGDMNDQDINIKVEKGVVYIDISDKLLFKSGSYNITARAKSILAKVAKVLNNQPNVEFMVEGHTDNVPFRNGLLQDNWDLSVKRATSVVRILQKQYGISPAKIIAAGRGEYQPLTSNGDNNGRAINRRTRIVILPQLDQFFKLLESQG